MARTVIRADPGLIESRSISRLDGLMPRTMRHNPRRGPPRPAPRRAGDSTFVPSRALPVCTASTSAAVSPWAMARARAVSYAALVRGVVDCASHLRTAVLMVSHLRPTFRPGRSPRCNRSYTVSAETVRNCAVRWTSSTSGKRPVGAGAVAMEQAYDPQGSWE